MAMLLLFLPLAASAAQPQVEPSAATLKALEAVGTWDGKTASAELAGPYADPLQAQVAFGQRSFYLAPWRAYMDTWPASQYLDCLGINFNVGASEAEAVAAVLAEAGIRSARVEIGMGSFKFDDPTQLGDLKGAQQRLAALKKHGIRPLILLNANSGMPCPTKRTDVKLLKDAAAGARELFVDKTDDIKLGYTGLRGQAYQIGFPLIVKVEKETGRCELSAPLPKPVAAGRLELYTLKYAPFGGEFFADGTPNPAAKETVDGWMTYVAAICRIAKETLGAEGAADAGFDLEVWNEYTFGSQYLEDKNYYSPPREYKRPRFTYKGEGVPGTYFVPTFRTALPETFFYGYKTEQMVRDVLPWPDLMKGHGRLTHPEGGQPAEVWQTEFNFDRQPWAEHLLKQAGVAKDDPKFVALMHSIGAKALLRTYFFMSHKGLKTIEIFAARGAETNLGVIPTAFFQTLKKDGYQLTDAVRALRGKQLEVLSRATKIMKAGEPIKDVRPPSVAKLVEEKPRLVFKGDGTPAHPDRFNRDDFACLPYQLSGRCFAVAYYVVTRNMGHEWAKDRDVLDPARYDMPEQTFQLTLTGVRGEGAKVSAYDPMLDREVPAKILAAGAKEVTVSLPTVDYPRLLVIREAEAKP